MSVSANSVIQGNPKELSTEQATIRAGSKQSWNKEQSKIKTQRQDKARQGNTEDQETLQANIQQRCESVCVCHSYSETNVR